MKADEVPLWTILRSREEFGGMSLPLLTVKSESGVEVRDLSQGRQPSEDMSSYRVVRVGDLVVNRLWAKFGAYGEARHEGIISPAYWVFKVDGSIVYPRFLHYLLRSEAYRQEIGRRSKNLPPNGYDIPWDQFKKISIPLPLLEEQRRIADFLDAETARIDKLDHAFRKTLDRLGERRATGVAAAVSGEEHTNRRPSGLSWLESSPAAWQEVRLSLVARMGSGHTPSRAKPEWWVDCTIPWITTGEVKQVRDDRREEIFETRENISALGLANSAAELHPAETVVLCRTASAGYSAVMGTHMATSQDFVTWTCGPRLDPFYLLWCLRAMRADLLGRLATGSTHKTIYVPDLQMLRIPLPGIEEQRLIVSRIREKNESIDGLVDKITRQIDLLAERRQALISAAVTGQIDVSSASGRGIEE
ncbi:restriction endonuclease subunit S [Saccharopolyspora shandongensis]|uniref:restriction endonuclease subunit S n=1 Tax=Saccharopolyspora shandongensis TaxID=418495 RepID=UPI0033FFEED3